MSTYPLVDLSVLQLDEPGADGGDVALLVGEGDAAGALGVAQLGVGVDARVAHPAVQPVHDHGQLNCIGRNRLLLCSIMPICIIYDTVINIIKMFIKNIN